LFVEPAGLEAVDGVFDDGWGAAVPVKGQEIEATILFADISSFSSRTLNLSPTETLAFVNTFFAWITAEALRVGPAIVDKYIGDEIMVIFSPAFGSQDAFADAVQTARRMGENDFLDFCPHMGIAAGVVTAGFVGTLVKYNCSVFGAPVALAARCAGLHSGQAASSSIVFPAALAGDRPLADFFPSSPGQHLLTNFSKPQIPLLDLRPLMERIENLAPSAKATDRLPMLALYAMFNGMIVEQDRRPNWLEFLSRWDSELEQCSIELLSPHVILGSQVPWPPEECVAAFEQYQRSKYKTTATNLPRLAEIAVMAEIANLFLDAGQVDRFEEWTNRAILDSAGWKMVQDQLRGCRDNRQRVDVQHLLGRPPTANAWQGRPGPEAGAVTEEGIRLRAYFKWEGAGRPEGDGVLFWLDAEKELRAGG
jgi:class 3 adenylate cyclase